MNDQVFELLNDKIDKVDAKVDKLDEKINQILQFKWQILGGSVVLSSIASIIMTIVLALIK